MKNAACFALIAVIGLWIPQTPFVAADMPWPKPTSKHDALKQLEGEWDASVEVYTHTGEPPIRTPGKEIVESSCGGLWYTIRIDCTDKGLPYEGRGLVGFDPMLDKFTAMWVDVTGDRFTASNGTLSTNGSLVFTGNGPDPRAHEQTIGFKQVVEFPKKKERVATLYLIEPNGAETMWMRTEYTLRKRR